MATTSPDNLRTPDPGDPYNLVSDLATLAGDVQDALNDRGNAFKGTAAERAIAESSVDEGSLWVDTDGIKMIWRKGVSGFEPAVWDWAGTTSQMNGFTQAPNGFRWSNITDNREYLRLGGAWVGDTPLSGSTGLSSPSGGAAVYTDITFSPAGYFSSPPSVQVSIQGGMNASVTINYGPSDITKDGFRLNLARSSTTNTMLFWEASRV